eukprot:scaffold127499_cov31-Tisochrysis_lutea.AAC.3
MMYVTISISRCGWRPKPRCGWTRSSLSTRSAPKLEGPPLHSAKLKWKREVSQLGAVQLVERSFSGLPNQAGGGSDL